MSNENEKLEHNKAMVDQFMLEKKYSFAEIIPILPRNASAEQQLTLLHRSWKR